MTIRFKLIMGFAFVLLLLATISTMSIIQMENMGYAVKRVDKIWLPGAIAAGNLKSSAWNVDDLLSKYVLEPDVKKMKVIQVQLNAALADEKNKQKTFKSGITDSQVQSVYNQFTNDWSEYVKQIPQIITVNETGNDKLANELIKKANPAFDTVKDDLNQLSALSASRAKTNTDNVIAILNASIVLILVLSAFALLSGMVMAWLLSAQISKPIQAIRNISVKIAKGDLRVQELTTKAKDEVAELMTATNTMVSNLKQLITSVANTSEQVAAASEELSASSDETTKATNQIAFAMQEVANGSEKQMTATKESSHAMVEIASGIERVAATSTVVSQSSMETTKLADQGNESIHEAVFQMDSIYKSVENTSLLIQQLNDHSQKIGQIIEVITGIAGQTNLLSLNAAIEAARAGEHGRGFAVVAEEVRKLAEQSAQSAREITSIIREIQSNTTKSVSAMEQVTQETKQGLTVIDKAGEAFANIVQAAQNVSEQVQEVTMASEEMSATTQEVTASIEVMSGISEKASGEAQNVASASEEQLASMEEITASAASLSKLAQDLQQMIGQFQL